MDIPRRINGLSLFSGIGGLDLALSDWVRPIAYCEIDPYCQGVLLSRQASRDIQRAPIWDDVRSFSMERFTLEEKEKTRGIIDIIYGGFPCQDISIAGLGKGLEGERSGLFFEIVRLSNEIKPRWIFLENVPAITTRGGLEVVKEIAKMGYDCRWITITASSLGALHKRERWFLLAHTKREGLEGHSKTRKSKISEFANKSVNDGNANSEPGEQTNTCTESEQEEKGTWGRSTGQYWPFESREHWQKTVSGVCRVTDGVSFLVDRLRGLGNSVCPIQAKEAFKILMGLK